jgi:hypothetical protein
MIWPLGRGTGGGVAGVFGPFGRTDGYVDQWHFLFFWLLWFDGCRSQRSEVPVQNTRHPGIMYYCTSHNLHIHFFFDLGSFAF